MLTEEDSLGEHISRSIELLNNDGNCELYTRQTNSQFSQENQIADLQQQYQHLLHQNHILQEHLNKLEHQNQILQQQLLHSRTDATNSAEATAHIPQIYVERAQSTGNLQSAEARPTEINSDSHQTTSAQHQLTKKRGLSKVSNYSDAKRRMLINCASNDITSINRYSILESVDESEENVNNNEPQVENVKIPPICLRNAGNITLLTKDLKELIGNGFTLKTIGNSVKIFMKNVSEYRKVRKYCEEKSVPYYTYCVQTEKNLSVVIKNVPIIFTEEEIYNELENLNYPIKKVTRLTNREQLPFKVVALELSNSTEGKEIFKLDKLLHCIVKVEIRRKPQGPPQCKKCFTYGHTKNYCTMPPNCGYCAEQHWTKDCKLLQSTNPPPPICTLCKENHMASSNQCKYFPKRKRIHQSNQLNTNFQAPQSHQNYENKTHSQTFPQQTNINQNPLHPQLAINNRQNTTSPTYAQTVTQNTIQTNITQIIMQMLPTIVNQITATLIPQIQNIVSNQISNIIRNG